ncbi:MAG: class I SAM-dependent methyltransferase [Terracidiphilus sp.]|jgi:SAM-dependent methyltransferase
MHLNLPDLAQASSHAQIALLQREAILAHGRQLERSLAILEAGCGQRWSIDLTGMDYTLTGIDLDPVALGMRQHQVHDLDTAICGDLCTVELPEASFDVVFSSFVLEHVPRADLALENLVKWLKPGGLLILRLPERKTAHGFYTRMLPHWAHVWYYRNVLHSPFAGQPGYAPYPTYYHPVIGRERLLDFLADHNVKCLSCCGDGFKRTHSDLKKKILRAVVKLTAILSLGYLAADFKDILYIAMKSSADQL